VKIGLAARLLVCARCSAFVAMAAMPALRSGTAALHLRHQGGPGRQVGRHGRLTR
jgi:hypothetical protein